MFCEQCGSKLQPTAKFCNSCGCSVYDVKIDSESTSEKLNSTVEKADPYNFYDSDSKIQQMLIDNGHTTTEFFIKTIGSAGLYFYIYTWHLQKLINDNFQPEKKLNKILFVWASMFSWVSYVQILFGDDVKVFAGILTLFAIGFWTYWNFQMKKILEDNVLYKFNINFTLNSFYTFIFGSYYFCYCINDLKNIKKRDDYLKSVRG